MAYSTNKNMEKRTIVPGLPPISRRLGIVRIKDESVRFTPSGVENVHFDYDIKIKCQKQDNDLVCKANSTNK